MALERWELAQRQKGNVAGAEMARVLREQFGDVPLPVVEAESGIKRFSPEAREALEEEGYVIYPLTGQSIKSLRESGGGLWSTWHEGYEFESLPSMTSEVAINPGQLFLPESNRKTYAEQEVMVKEFSKKLGRKIKGVKAVIGEAPDYIELAFSYLEVTSNYLFGRKYNYDYARTRTPTAGSFVASVGFFNAKYGLDVVDRHRGYGYNNVWAAPLVVSSKDCF